MPRVLAVFWAGGDIKQLKKRKFWRMILPFNKTKHVCENAVEQKMLKEIDISAIVQPCLVDDLNEFGISFKPSKAPDVYLTINDGREKEYGIEFIEETLAPAVPDVTFHVFGVNVEYASRDNVVYHRRVPGEVFNEKIKQYQGALRLNVFDGFAEPLAKSAIMGQYPISAIAYPHITHTPTLRTLIKALNELKNKKEPNYEAVAYWRRELTKA